MFIKVPVYFEVEGPIKDVGILQEFLLEVIESSWIGRKSSIPIDISAKDRKNLGIPSEIQISLIRRIQVLNGMR